MMTLKEQSKHLTGSSNFVQSLAAKISSFNVKCIQLKFCLCKAGMLMALTEGWGQQPYEPEVRRQQVSLCSHWDFPSGQTWLELQAKQSTFLIGIALEVKYLTFLHLWMLKTKNLL